jgi:hypothetical protein
VNGPPPGEHATVLVKRALLLGGLAVWLAVALLAPWAAPRSPRAGIGTTVPLFATGVIVVNVIVALVDRKWPGQERDPILVAAWSVAQGLTLSLLVLLGIGVLSAGIGVGPGLVAGVVVAGAGAGLAHGWWMNRGRFPIDPAGDLPTAGATSGGSRPGATRGIDLRPLWFSLGCAAAFLLLIAVALVANRYRGPTDGFAELGTSRHVYDQRPVDRAVGAALAVLGWSVGVGLVWRRASPAFVAGLVVAATLLGLAFAIKP